MPPRSPSAERCCSPSVLIHSVMMPTTGSGVSPNSVDEALVDPGGVPRAFDAGHLHAEADAEERHVALAGEADAGDLAFRAALAEPAGHEDRVHRLELRGDLRIVLLEHLGVDPADVDLDPVGHAAVDQRLVERLVGVGQADVLADHADRHFAFGVLVAVDDVVPARQVGRGRCRGRNGAAPRSSSPSA